MDTTNPNDPAEDEPATTTVDPNAEPATPPDTSAAGTGSAKDATVETSSDPTPDKE
jgi:hypothetical protein